MIDDYQNCINLLAVFSEATAQLAELESDTNKLFLDLIDEQKSKYAALQKTLTESEAALKELAARHPEWFEGARTVKTPYGSVAARKATNHEAPDEVSAIARIKAAQARAIKQGNEVLATQLGALVRVEESLNFDALAEIAVEDLAKFGIVRKVGDSVTIKPAKVAIGQAVKAAEKRSAKDVKKESGVAA